MIKIKTKSYDEIKKTLDRDSIIHHGEHDELYFAKQMIGFCGKTIDIRHHDILDNFFVILLVRTWFIHHIGHGIINGLSLLYMMK